MPSPPSRFWCWQLTDSSTCTNTCHSLYTFPSYQDYEYYNNKDYKDSTMCGVKVKYQFLTILIYSFSCDVQAMYNTLRIILYYN